MTTIALRNVGVPPGPLDLHLPHDIVCAASGECGCTRQSVGVPVVDPATRKSRVEQRIQRFPRTITLLAKGSKGDAMTGLHTSVLLAPDVAAAIARREIAVVKTVEPAAPMAQPPAPPAPEPVAQVAEGPAEAPTETPPDAPAETKTGRRAPRSEVS